MARSSPLRRPSQQPYAPRGSGAGRYAAIQLGARPDPIAAEVMGGGGVRSLARAVPIVRFGLLALLLASCSTVPESPPPTAAPASVAPPATAAQTAEPPTEVPTASLSPSPTVLEGFVRVTFRLLLTGGGVTTATFGVEVHEVGKAGTGPTLLCSAHGGAPACRDGGSYSIHDDLPLGATVDYRFYQELDASGSPYLDIFPTEFVADATSTLKTQSFDIQP